MATSVTKTFEFSASYSRADKVIGHNYTMRATFLAAAEADEDGLTEKIQKTLIQKIHSKDLGEHVDFLKGVAIHERALLKSFWPIIVQAAKPVPLKKLSLERDRSTRWTLTEGECAP